MFLLIVLAIAALTALFFRRRSAAAPPAETVFLAPKTIKQSNAAMSAASGPSASRWYLTAIAGTVIAAIIGLGLVTRPDLERVDAPLALQPSATPTPVASLQPSLPSAAATPAVSPTAAPQPPQLAIVRIEIPGLEIDAPIVTLGVDPDGAMQTPAGPTEVGWYNFSSRPGLGGNLVFSGHLDYLNYGPAVFWRLREAQQGDIIRVVLEDGSVATYTVSDVQHYDEATAPVQAIIGPTDTETVTLITCAGSFDPASREYNQRLVVHAVADENAAITRP
jgi:LPXTG-site transpeptidase (sortase) family protein